MRTMTILDLDGTEIKIPIPNRCYPITDLAWASLLEEGLGRLLILESNQFLMQKGKEFNICGCLGKSREAEQLKFEIGLRLEAYSFFSSWLRFGKRVRIGDYGVQQARRAWMLDMIEEFKGATLPQ